VKGLDRMHQCRTVVLLQDVRSNLEYVVRTKTEELPIEGGVMESAEREPVADEWLSSGLGIGDDVRRVEQLFVTEVTEGALTLIGREHPLAESSLVQTDANGRRDVAPTRTVRVLNSDVYVRGRPGREKQMLRIVDGNRHGQARRIIPDDVYGPRRQVLARRDAVKVRERKPTPHRLPQALILWMIGIAPAIPVPQEFVLSESIVVRPARYCRDG